MKDFNGFNLNANGTVPTQGHFLFCRAQVAPDVAWRAAPGTIDAQDAAYLPKVEISEEVPPGEVWMMSPASGETLAKIINLGRRETR